MDRFSQFVGYLLSSTLFLIAPSLVLAGDLAFSAAAFSGAENSTTISLTVQRSGDVTAAASVTVSSTDGTAIAGLDYVSVTSLVNWTAGDSDEKTIELTLIDDALVEADETLQLNLLEVSGDDLGEIQTATITISDYEEGQLQFAQSAYSSSENTASIEITVSRINGSEGELTGTYTTADNTALSDTDYLAATGNLLFGDGVLQQSIFLVVVDDAVGEVNQNFLVELTASDEEATESTLITSTTVTIIDDDADFTPALGKLNIISENIQYSETLDMGQVSLNDSNTTFLDVINDIPVLSLTGLTAQQNSDGTVEIDLGAERFLVRPLALIRAELLSEELVKVNPDQSGYFATSENVRILFQPSLSGMDILQSVLADLGTPEVAVNEHGNITIKVHQGPPPLEINADGEVVINNSYYDRYNLRPSFISTASSETETGVKFLSHPVLSAETMLAVVTSDPLGNRQQLVSTAAVIADELFESLWEDYEVENPAFIAPGLVSFDKAGVKHGLFADYVIRRVEKFTPGQIGLQQVADVNGDGLADFRMIYSSGDEQYFFYIAL